MALAAEIRRSGSDPIVHTREAYLAVRTAYRERLRARYADVLADVRSAHGAVGPFCDHIERRLASQDIRRHRRFDPYFSTAINVWIQALARGLAWVRSGARPDLLERYADAHAFDADVAIEFPSDDDDEPAPGVVRLPHAIWVRPADALLRSRWLRSRVTDALPGFPGAAYAVLRADTAHAVVRHVVGALDLLAAADPDGADALTANLHTLFVALLRGRKTTFATRNDCPGTVIVGLSEERLERDDRSFTASQLYHEHCHIKLAVCCEAERVTWPADQTLISAFKNENRDLETMLHTAYTIAMECRMRRQLIATAGPAERSRALGYLGAVIERLHLTTEVLAYGLAHARGLRGRFDSVVELGRAEVAAIRREIAHEPMRLRRLHAQERARVEARHAWDIGQFLVRGIDVVDPDLSGVRVAAGEASFIWRGTAQQARLEPARLSYGDYGRYVDAVL